MNILVAKKAIGILMAAALLTSLVIIGNIEKAKMQEAGIRPL